MNNNNYYKICREGYLLSNTTTFDTIILNLILIILWNMLIFMFSIKLNTNFFDPSKKLYSQKPWEKDGKFYINSLHIKKWKDSLPQYVGKNGFSKRNMIHFSNLSGDYIYEFIVETCRAEWNHWMCCFFVVISFFINSVEYAITFSIVSLVTNVPFIFIQRYNRIRLNHLLIKHRKKQHKRCEAQKVFIAKS